MIHVRPARPDDPAALAALAAETFPLACPPGTSATEIDAFLAAHLSVERFAEYVTDPRYAVVVAEHEETVLDDTVLGEGTVPDPGIPAAYALLVLSGAVDPDVERVLTRRPAAYLSKFYVRPGHHGRGVAAALMASTLEVAAEHGAAGLWLGVNRLNARAQRFYVKSGFTVVGHKTQRVGTDVHRDFVMERPVEPAVGQ
ncbi:GNAT family N-acetyltransferase [Oerskovia flava]|uniref:GNAT family N-acetyltransferase n=1 Tax=Oerskovia flava TaxID=2986422 RepID=UPI00223F73F2|nr:GNAT family N-acetyltransferase [Oerskovia sp. JB1-3-2]